MYVGLSYLDELDPAVIVLTHLASQYYHATQRLNGNNGWLFIMSITSRRIHDNTKISREEYRILHEELWFAQSLDVVGNNMEIVLYFFYGSRL